MLHHILCPGLYPDWFSNYLLNYISSIILCYKNSRLFGIYRVEILDTKKRPGKAMVESVACYGSEVWSLKTEEQRKLLALEMDYLRWSTTGYM